MQTVGVFEQGETMQRRHIAPLLGALIGVFGLLACSDTGSTGNGGQATCTGKFCIEEDRRIGVTPNSLIYADMAPGADPQEIELRVRHDGNSGQLQLQSATFDSHADEFSIVGGFSAATLNPGASVVWKVRYAPKAAGGKTLHLIIKNNATDATRRSLQVPILVEQGGASLIVQPDPIDFGNVPAGTPVPKTVKLYNNGTQQMKFKEVSISKTGSADFTISVMPKMDEAIAAGSSQTMEVSYAPTGGDNDESSISFLTDDGQKTIVPVRGNEIAPSIAVIPPKLNFGNMKLNDKATLPMKILSKGLAPLQISKIEVAGISLVKTIQVTPSGAQTLESGGNVLEQVELTASQVMPNTGSPIANLIIYSNDPKTPELHVEIFAQTDTGSLMVTPADVVDFAIVGKGKNCTKATDTGCIKVQRKVELFNQGSAGLTISSVTLDADPLGEFALVPGNFPPVSNAPTSSDLAAGTGDYFLVQFVALGPTGQTAKTKLHINSNDPQKPVWDIELVALRADGASCNIQLQPPIVNFGLIPYGEQKLLQLTLKNIGSGYCAFDHVNIGPCQGNGLPPPIGPGAIKCSNGGTSLFKTFAPGAKLFNLAPGDSGKLQVQFQAPADGGLFATGEVQEYDGLIVASFKDVATGLVSPYPAIDFTKAGDVSAAKPNMLAKVGKAAVQVMPGDVDFGIVSVGCKSTVQTVSVYNVGATDVNVTKVELDNCGPEVLPVQWPGIPKAGLPVSQSKPTGFSVQYGPQNTGKDNCQMIIYTGLSGACVDKNNQQTGGTCQSTADCTKAGDWCMGTLFMVPLQGEGTLDTEFTDEFVQGTGKDVDVLFVVDDSGSMGNKQDNLSKNIATFIQIAQLWSNNYHLGVVTTDMDDGKKSGKLQTDKKGERILTPKSPDPTASLQYLAVPGEGGSGTEYVFEAAAAALTAPLITNTSKSCNNDADCGGGQAHCVKGADDGKLFCGGYNRSFLRKNAGLEIVALSDEQEQSTGTLSYYQNLFYSLKGLANKNLFHFHAITGDAGSGCNANGGAEDGSRLFKMVQDTGGKFGSICDSNYAQVLKDIGSVAFGLMQQFFLTRTPEPATLVVKINGKVCAPDPASWTYDAASNTVTFNDKGPCMPQAGDKVSIYYKMLCFP